ncbi:CIC11C00000003139 [Sungouiella intermedia]|uniref:CIC11C00000003139 n=1 Tax=Sungouiella intermedia TaxID=45354 RepID=A0A1L0DP18_9ASCO|nr:CIC11C00000003139 [[Candida] intermedia]
MTSISNVTYDMFVDRTGTRDQFEIDPDAFEILSTVRYDPGLTKESPTSIDKVTKQNFFLLPEHVERLKYSASFFIEAAKLNNPHFEHSVFDINETFIYKKILQALEESGISLDQPLKIRLLLSLNGEMKVELYLTPARNDLLDGLSDEYPESEKYDVYVDKTPVLPSPFTSFKTTSRKVYSDARSRALPGKLAKEEVILVNTLGEVTEGSVTNIAVLDKEGTWVTPQLTSGCLCGVTRYMLLKKNLMKEGKVSLDDLIEGQDVLLLNGILGVVRGTIKGFVN